MDRRDGMSRVFEALIGLRASLTGQEALAAETIAAADPAWRKSACNLVHYLALRQVDLREIQQELAQLGLSSLGRTESHVLANLDAVIRAMASLDGLDAPALAPSRDAPSHEEGAALLAAHTDALLGPPRRERSVRIMVTAPAEAATDEGLVDRLVASGMDILRVNAAHDHPAAWRAMAHHLESAANARGASCRVELDLPGPKLRTGPIAPGPCVIRWQPERDARGAVVSRARVWLTPEEQPTLPDGPADAILQLPAGFLRDLWTGDEVELRDLRGKKRALEIVGTQAGSAWAEAAQTAYVGPETMLRSERGKACPRVPPLTGTVTLRTGDILRVTRAPILGEGARDEQPAHVACCPGDAIAGVEAGASIWFDDGKIGGLVEDVDAEGLTVRITRARAGGAELAADKGINLPGTRVPLPALGPQDLAALEAAGREAQMIGLSFARTAEDVEALQERLAAWPGERPGIVLKVETQEGFEHLPEMLLAAMRTPPVGVMIARGDLGVECGFERLAEIQEEILWIAEAAHVPVIWATQVLETLAKKGQPSRAEITDAAMGERAECVMLNKGAHVETAVRVLSGILERMQAHQRKKTPMLRRLRTFRNVPRERA